ncbi:MAG: crotonase/enoyl-CoA hydratase family protein [Acidimicrobiales bacterium]
MTDMGSDDKPVILRERRGQVEVLTLNRPEARNAVNGEVAKQMTAALDDLDKDGEVRVIILTGAGDKAFCAGMDLKAFGAGGGGSIGAGAGGFAGFARRSVPVPVIAAVNGPALAGGFELVLACDLVVAAENAIFGIPEAKRGLLAAGGGLVRLPKRVPLATAMELALTGDSITAQRGYELGLVNRVVPADRVMDESLALAGRIIENAPLSVRYSREITIQAAEVSEEEAWKLSDEATAKVFTSADAMEGPLAFAEKRAPNWQGR